MEKNKKILIAIVTTVISLIVTVAACVLGVKPDDLVANLPDTDYRESIGAADISY